MMISSPRAARSSTTSGIEDLPQDGLAKSAALHLLPGVVVMSAYLALAPLVMRAGFPPALGLLLAFVLAGIPIELGFLLYLGRKRNGTYSLRGIVRYRQAMPAWQYLALFLLLFAVAFGALFVLTPVTRYLATHVFAWLPAFLLPDGAPPNSSFPRSAVLVTLIAGLVVDGFINPIVEELYFRGHLLPRLARFGRLAPLINAFLFSVQHYWQPYNYPLLFVLQLAVVYVVWWKRNIYIGMLVHCAGNVIGATLTLLGFLSG